MILFFDTETTGLYSDRLPPAHPDQPSLVQIAAVLTRDDGEPVSEFSLIVNPGVPIPERASAVHGITDDVATEVGVAPATALGLFDFMARRAGLIVAHNVKFDINIIGTLYERRGKVQPAVPTACTMEMASPIVNLPPTERMVAAGYNKPKPPKLEECIRHFFGETLDGAHDALVDVRACARVFFHINAQEAAA